jgi:4-hydroxy-tetrahydrodipicolinate synthase
MVVPSPIYFTNPQETVTTLKAMASAGGLPVMIYSNRMAYRVDVTGECLEELAKDDLFVAIKESSDDIRRTIDIVNQFGDRFDLFTGVDNLAFEALTTGAIGWVAGVVTSLPRETVVLYQLIKQKRYDEALSLYRWMRPLLDLDVSTYLVQNLKLIEVHAIQSNDRVRLPRLPLSGERLAQAEKIVKQALATRPELPKI